MFRQRSKTGFPSGRKAAGLNQQWERRGLHRASVQTRVWPTPHKVGGAQLHGAISTAYVEDCFFCRGGPFQKLEGKTAGKSAAKVAAPVPAIYLVRHIVFRSRLKEPQEAANCPGDQSV